MKEIVLVVLCVIFYGSATFFKRLGLSQLNPYQFSLITGICYTLLTPLWVWMIRSNASIITTQYSSQSIMCAVIYSSFSVLAGLTLAFLLQSSKNPGALIVMINLSSLVTLMLSYIFLNEQLNSNKIIAIILGIASLFIMNC